MDWLTVNIPEWSNFKVVSHAEYLGFEVGPTAGSHQWDKVLRKVEREVAVLAHSGATPSVSVFNYNIRLVPKFAYKAQLFPPPPGLDVLEKNGLATS